MDEEWTADDGWTNNGWMDEQWFAYHPISSPGVFAPGGGKMIIFLYVSLDITNL